MALGQLKVILLVYVFSMESRHEAPIHHSPYLYNCNIVNTMSEKINGAFGNLEEIFSILEIIVSWGQKCIKNNQKHLTMEESFDDISGIFFPGLANTNLNI